MFGGVGKELAGMYREYAPSHESRARPRALSQPC